MYSCSNRPVNNAWGLFSSHHGPTINKDLFFCKTFSRIFYQQSITFLMRCKHNVVNLIISANSLAGLFLILTAINIQPTRSSGENDLRISPRDDYSTLGRISECMGLIPLWNLKCHEEETGKQKASVYKRKQHHLKIFWIYMSIEVSAPFSLYELWQNNVKVGKVVWLKLHRKPFILDSEETKAVALYFSDQRSWILVSETVKESLWQLEYWSFASMLMPLYT